MRWLSFYATKEQFLDGSKDITRRITCPLKPGEYFLACEKMQGIKKGEHRVVLGECICISNDPERLDTIIGTPFRGDFINGPKSEVAREGFPCFTPDRFVEFFLRMNAHRSITHETVIRRVRFRRLP